MTTAATEPVVVVGAGPTGLTVAALLAGYGVPCLVLDRQTEPYLQPRAVHLDDEVFRILARLGLADAFAAVSRPMRGLRLVDADGRLLAEFERASGLGQHGYPQASLFDQPDLEELLRAELARRGVPLHRGLEVTALHANQDSAALRLDVLDRATGERSSIAASAVLGCDGAGSGIRSAIGATLREQDFAQRWLVVDLATDADLDVWDGVTQVCDTVRPATFMRIGVRRYRWEFRLRDSETAADFQDLPALRPLIADRLRDVPDGAVEVLRVAEYTFRAAVADRWRQGRVFLLGDAAHLTPPFTGQGLGAGLRDADNLAWKLAGVLGGALPDHVLDSYQAEREPHVRALIRLARIVGWAMSAGGRPGDLLRRAVAPRFRLVPGLRARVSDSTTPALRGSAWVARSVLPGGLAGTSCPNAVVAPGTRLDACADGRFVVVGFDAPSRAEQARIEASGSVGLVVGPASELGRWLRGGRARAALVRPDGAVLRAGRRLGPLLDALPSGELGSRRPAPAARTNGTMAG